MAGIFASRISGVFAFGYGWEAKEIVDTAPHKVLVIQHSELDRPGEFGVAMDEAGIAWRTCDPWRSEPFPPLDDYDALLAMGGPQQTDEEHLHPWLADEKALLREALARGLPVLGVCLGCQLLADAHGGRVGPLERAEVGIFDYRLTVEGRADSLFAGLPPAPLALQWHFYAVTELPERATLLASSPACAIQAFRLGERAYGVQFHTEVGAAEVRETEAFPAYVTALERQEGKGAFDRLVAETARHEATLRANGRRLFQNFARLLKTGDTNLQMP